MAVDWLEKRVALIASVVALAGACVSAAAAQSRPAPIKNIVLVHGAWVDGSGWKPVYDILTKDGYIVSVVQEPLTSLADDVAATKRILDLQQGSCILVGHSYGGSIITEAGVHPNVAGLVYVAAHAPDVGENEAALGRRMPSAVSQKTGAIQTAAGAYTFLNPGDFYEYFAADLPRSQADFESRSQILTAARVFSAPISAAAWRTKPSWAIVAGADMIINPNLERWYYARARSHTTVAAGASHSVYESRPELVAAVIERAAQHASDESAK